MRWRLNATNAARHATPPLSRIRATEFASKEDHERILRVGLDRIGKYIPIVVEQAKVNLTMNACKMHRKSALRVEMTARC